MTVEAQETQTPEQTAQESSAAFAAGFDQARGNEAPVAEPIKTEPAATVATETAKVEPQPAAIPAEVKAELDSLRKAIADGTKLPEDRLRRIEGTIGGLSQLTKELKTALDKAGTVASAKGADSPSQQEVNAAIRDPAKWKQLREDFPDWADAIEPELADIRASVEKLAKTAPVDTAKLRTEIATDIDARIKTATQDAEPRIEASARAKAYLDFKHGLDWEARIGSPEFEAWYAKQPKETQDLSASPNVNDALKLLDLYTAHQKRAAEEGERKKRLERAVTPSGVAAAPATTEDPEAAFAAGFDSVRRG